MDFVTENDRKILEEIQQAINYNNVLLLLRGCPGSGKTAMANWLKMEIGEQCVTILSTNDQFDDKLGVYRPNNVFLRKAYENTIYQAETEMTRNKLLIIIDNKNIKYWEMTPYLDIAEKYDYSVKLTETNTPWKMDPHLLASKNVHDVDVKRIRKMLQDFRTITVEELQKKHFDNRICIKKKRKASPEPSSDEPQDENSFTYIMKKQKNEELQFRIKYPFADKKGFTELCRRFPEFDRIYLAELYKKVRSFRKVVKMLPRNQNYTTSIEMSVCPELSLQKREIKMCKVIKYDWFCIKQILVDIRYLERDLSDTMKTSIYKTILYKAKDYCEELDLQSKVEIVLNSLFTLKEIVAKNITKLNYNKIDFHRMTVAETTFIFEEAIHDYALALKDYPDMKSYLSCITGRGKHSRGGKPILKPMILDYVKNHKLRHRLFTEGEIRIYLQGCAKLFF